MNKTQTYYFSLIIFYMIGGTSNAQAVCAESMLIATQKKGTKVVLFTESLGESGNSYYYLPYDLHISEIKGRQEFLFQPFNDNGKDGAIMHILLTWEPKPETENVIKQSFISHDSTGVLAGNVAVEEKPEQAFSISSNNSLGEILNRSLTSKGRIPTHAGSKMALSFHFREQDVQMVQNAIRNPQKLKGVIFQMQYLYQVKRCGSLSEPIEKKELILKKDFGELISPPNQK